MTTSFTSETYNASSVEALRTKVRDFICNTVIDAEPRPGCTLSSETLNKLREKAKKKGIFAPHVSTEFGGLGLPLRYWSDIFQEAGYSPIGPIALNIMAPDEGNMHMMGIIATPEQQEEYLAPLAAAEIQSSVGMTETHAGTGSEPRKPTCSAVYTNGKWMFNGHNLCFTGANVAVFCIAMMRTEQHGNYPAEARMFLVDMDNPGVRL